MLNDNGGEIILRTKGKSLEECKQKLYTLYGSDYSITGKTQTLYGGFLGFGQKEGVEVTYTVRNKPQPLPAYTNPMMASFQTAPLENTQTVSKSELDTFAKNRDSLLKTTTDTVLATQVSKKLDDIQKQLQGLSVSSQDKHPTIQKIEDMLAENEFTFKYINKITDRIKSEFSFNELDDFKKVERSVVDWIGQSISIAPDMVYRPPHVIINVGPTGVGKTTTIAKLASNMIIEAKEKQNPRPEIEMLTIDYVRVGALEQLSRFGSMLGVEVLKAEFAKDVQKIYEEYKDRADYIFIDTPGYSPNDSSNIGDMKSVLDVNGLNPDIYLSVAASTKASDLQTIMQNYEPFAYRSVIITKCDETKKYGNIISVLAEKNKSVSYITDGQHVPRNIKKATVVDFLIRLTGFEIDRVHIEDIFGAE